MTDTRSMLFAQPGDEAALQKLSDHAFVKLFRNVIQQGDGPVNAHHVASTLAPSEGLFIDRLSTIGRTQETVIEALEMLVIEYRIRVFVLDEEQRIMEITPEAVRLMRNFPRLDVVLVKCAA